MSCVWNRLQLRPCSTACRGIATVGLSMTIIVKQTGLMASGCFIGAHSGTALTADRYNCCSYEGLDLLQPTFRSALLSYVRKFLSLRALQH
jgi:hypothetical protein